MTKAIIVKLGEAGPGTSIIIFNYFNKPLPKWLIVFKPSLFKTVQ